MAAAAASTFAELPPAVCALLAHSEMMHTGVEEATRIFLTEALTALPFSASDSSQWLRIFAEANNIASSHDAFAFTLADVVFLAPTWPPLRSLTVRDAARTWVLVDFLCLGSAASKLEDDLVQRYAEDPSAEADWRASLTVDGCPACDALWQLVSKKYAALRLQWKTMPLPPMRSVHRRLLHSARDV